MLKCREMTELANGYLENELPLGQRMQFRLHILMCQHCRRYMDQLTQTINLLASTRKIDTQPDIENGLVAILRQQRGSR